MNYDLFEHCVTWQTRLNALECIDRLLDSLDKMIILDDVLPFLTEIQCSDVDIIMAVVCTYEKCVASMNPRRSLIDCCHKFIVMLWMYATLARARFLQSTNRQISEFKTITCKAWNCMRLLKVHINTSVTRSCGRYHCTLIITMKNSSV